MIPCACFGRIKTCGNTQLWCSVCQGFSFEKCPRFGSVRPRFGYPLPESGAKIPENEPCSNPPFFSREMSIPTKEEYLAHLLVQRDEEILALKQEIAYLRELLQKVRGQESLKEAVVGAISAVKVLNEHNPLALLKEVLHTGSVDQQCFFQQFESWVVLYENQYNLYRIAEPQQEEYWRLRECITKVMFSWFAHTHSQHTVPALTVQLSLFLHHFGCAKPIWKLLSRLRLTLSYTKTKQLLAVAQSLSIPPLLGWEGGRTVGMVGADNCAYYNAHTFVRDTNEPLFFNTINWYHRMEDKPIKSTYSDGEVPLLEHEKHIAKEFW